MITAKFDRQIDPPYTVKSVGYLALGLHSSSLKSILIIMRRSLN